MSKADEMRARAARAGQRAATPPPPVLEEAPIKEPSAATTPSVVRSTPVRITADLPPQSYRSLVDYSAALANRLGRARVPHVNVIRALVVELSQDDELQQRIAKRVAQQLED